MGDVRLHSYNDHRAIGDRFRYHLWPGRAVLVDPEHGRDKTTVLGHVLGEHPIHRVGGGLLAGPVRGISVEAHGTGPVDGQSPIAPVQ